MITRSRCQITETDWESSRATVILPYCLRLPRIWCHSDCKRDMWLTHSRFLWCVNTCQCRCSNILSDLSCSQIPPKSWGLVILILGKEKTKIYGDDDGDDENDDDEYDNGEDDRWWEGDVVVVVGDDDVDDENDDAKVVGDDDDGDGDDDDDDTIKCWWRRRWWIWQCKRCC